VRIIVIDPFNREIREDYVNPRLFEVGPVAGGCLESGFHISRSAILYLHRYEAGQPGFLLSEQNMFFGFGLITGCDRSGSPRPTRVAVKDVAVTVRFVKETADGLGYET
jgi:hypothetical protein